MLNQRSSISILFLSSILMTSLFGCSNSERKAHPDTVLLDSVASLTQVYADNQANHKIEIFDFSKDSVRHEIFLVSTIGAKPLYAYLDQIRTDSAGLEKIEKLVLSSKANFTAGAQNIDPDSTEIKRRRSNQLNREVDSLKTLIKLEEKDFKAHPNQLLADSIAILKKEYSSRTGEVVKLAMKDYQKDISQIPSQVGMHEVLTRIITEGTYSKSESERIDTLIRIKR